MIFEGLRTDIRATLAYPIIFMLRRFSLVLIITVGREHLFAQICVMIFFSTLQVGYLATVMPSENLLGLKLDIFNEITTVCLVDLLTVFSTANLSKFDLEADILFLVFLFINLAVHLFFLIKTTVISTKENCKKQK